MGSGRRPEACYLLSEEEGELLVWASHRLLSLHGLMITFSGSNSGDLAEYKFLGADQKGTEGPQFPSWATGTTGVPDEGVRCSEALNQAR